jgi:hypothetical protein
MSGPLCRGAGGEDSRGVENSRQVHESLGAVTDWHFRSPLPSGLSVSTVPSGISSPFSTSIPEVNAYRSLFIFVAQVGGGIAAAAAVRAIIPGDDVLFAATLQSPATVTQGFLLEMFFTAELVFTILMLAGEKTKATFVAPVGIGLALFIAEMVGKFISLS